MAYPPNYKYTKEHEWISVEGTTGTVGITDYAQNSLGDIVFVELPKVGDTLEAGKIFGSVESVKTVSDLYSPVSGTVTAVNEELKDAPEKVNADANNTWMLKLDMKDAAVLGALLSAEQAEVAAHEKRKPPAACPPGALPFILAPRLTDFSIGMNHPPWPRRRSRQRCRSSRRRTRAELVSCELRVLSWSGYARRRLRTEPSPVRARVGRSARRAHRPRRPQRPGR